MNLKKIKDASHEERFNSLSEKFGDNPKHYLSMLSRCKGDKQIERAQKFYEFATNKGYTNVANAIKENYPEAFGEEPSESEVKSSFNEKYTNTRLRPANVFFRKLVRAIPTGLTVTTSQGDTSVGRDYEARNGRAWTVAVRYTIDYKGKSIDINVANITNEGGGSYGYIAGNRFYKSTWADAKHTIKWELKKIGIDADKYGL